MEHVRNASLRRDSVDVRAIEKKALQIAGNATTAEDVHPAIRYVLGALGDHHSFLMTASISNAPDSLVKVSPPERFRILALAIGVRVCASRTTPRTAGDTHFG